MQRGVTQSLKDMQERLQEKLISEKGKAMKKATTAGLLRDPF
jgi:hypothetical protein